MYILTDLSNQFMSNKGVRRKTQATLSLLMIKLTVFTKLHCKFPVARIEEIPGGCCEYSLAAGGIGLSPDIKYKDYTRTIIKGK